MQWSGWSWFLIWSPVPPPVTSGITHTFMFHRFFSSLARSKYSSLSLFSSIFELWSVLKANFTTRRVLFLLIITRSGLLVGIMWYVSFSKFQITLCISFSEMDYILWIYQLVEWLNFNFLRNFYWIIFFRSFFNQFIFYVIKRQHCYYK